MRKQSREKLLKNCRFDYFQKKMMKTSNPPLKHLISQWRQTKMNLLLSTWMQEKLQLWFLFQVNATGVFVYSVHVYSRTSRKRPPKMSSLGGCLWEVVAYRSFNHNRSNLVFSLEYRNCRNPCANAKAVFSNSQLKVNFKTKIWFFALRIFRFLYEQGYHNVTSYYPFFAP